MTQIRIQLSPLTEAFLQTARSRKSAVHTFRALFRTDTGQEIPEDLAVACVERYYAESGGKPWLRRKGTAS